MQARCPNLCQLQRPSLSRSLIPRAQRPPRCNQGCLTTLRFARPHAALSPNQQSRTTRAWLLTMCTYHSCARALLTFDVPPRPCWIIWRGPIDDSTEALAFSTSRALMVHHATTLDMCFADHSAQSYLGSFFLLVVVGSPNLGLKLTLRSPMEQACFSPHRQLNLPRKKCPNLSRWTAPVRLSGRGANALR